jgi:hypothetical protein
MHMILQNASIYRRHAIETVAASGWDEPVIRALSHLLRAEQTEEWLRVRVEFALGSMQRPDMQVDGILTDACLDAYWNLKHGELSRYGAPRSYVTDMHSSLFAVGDCFGAAGAEVKARKTREKLRPVLEDLANLEEPQSLGLRRAIRAAAYVLVVTAQPRIEGEKDLSQDLLESLSGHRDVVTADLAKWALSFRFASDGTVKPLLTIFNGGGYELG